MRITAAKISAVVTVAAVAALGAQYASAAPSHVSTSSKSANPNVAPLRNLAYQYSTATTHGTGQVSFHIPNPPNGVYAASFTANFFPQGTPAAPVVFSCYLTKNGAMRAQSTAASTWTSGFYVGVNGGNMVKVDSSANDLEVGCGPADGSAWQFGSKPVSVTFTRLDGLVNKSLNKTLSKGHLSAGVAGR